MWVRYKDPNRGVLLGMWGPGVAPKGDETDEKLPMNPEGDEVDVSQGVCMSTTTKPLLLLPASPAPRMLPALAERACHGHAHH